MYILYLSELGELVVDIIFLSLLVDTGHEQNPSLNGSLGSRFTLSLIFDTIIVSILPIRRSSVESTSLPPLCLLLYKNW